MEVGSEFENQGLSWQDLQPTDPTRKGNVVLVVRKSTVAEKNDHDTLVRGAVKNVGVGSLLGETCVKDRKVLMAGEITFFRKIDFDAVVQGAGTNVGFDSLQGVTCVKDNKVLIENGQIEKLLNKAGTRQGNPCFFHGFLSCRYRRKRDDSIFLHLQLCRRDFCRLWVRVVRSPLSPTQERVEPTRWRHGSEETPRALRQCRDVVHDHFIFFPFVGILELALLACEALSSLDASSHQREPSVPSQKRGLNGAHQLAAQF